MHREISWRVAASSLGQVALFFVAMAAAVLGGVPWISFSGVLLLGAVAVWMTILERGNRCTEAFGWAGTLLAWALLFLGREDIPRFGVLHMVAGLSVAVGVLTSGEWFAEEARRQRWRIMGLAWGGAASWGLL